MNVGENIKKFRTKKGLTQKELAQSINVTTTTIQNYENNRRNPTIKVLSNIALSLDVQLSDLICYEKLCLQDLLNTDNTIQENLKDSGKTSIISIPNGKEALKEFSDSLEILLNNMPKTLNKSSLLENTNEKGNIEMLNYFFKDMPVMPKKDTLNELNKLIKFLNLLYKYDIKLFIDFFSSIDYLMDIFKSLIDFIENQHTTNLENYKDSIKDKLSVYPQNNISKENFKTLKERIDLDIMYSQDLALKKACPELYKILSK
ncbi:helix-turn-helix transcriptional regulator [Clostridium sp. AWRP]|uniref:helix-turn-helix domain-containing protein n=1 Tax=Clostridium sp. AWRP TaxID=2212991 RepID=UPI000FDC076C|nr:helix-turn-helix transcriptional regulator [Clostridium sp. AWRP]AZV58384.1 helix-turn-helix domain-containing protein [Clostridium sp. AWRP]